jgi:hypothetical protein
MNQPTAQWIRKRNRKIAITTVRGTQENNSCSQNGSQPCVVIADLDELVCKHALQLASFQELEQTRRYDK